MHATCAVYGYKITMSNTQIYRITTIWHISLEISPTMRYWSYFQEMVHRIAT